jgi:hypothetical protein
VESRFAAIASGFLDDPNVTEGTGFGSGPGLRIGGKIFAMLVGGRLAVKLPRERIDELVEHAVGVRLETRRARPMKEWITVAATHADDWEALMRESREFVASVR